MTPEDRELTLLAGSALFFSQKSTSSAKRSTRIGATKLSTGSGADFDFDDIPFEVRVVLRSVSCLVVEGLH